MKVKIKEEIENPDEEDHDDDSKKGGAKKATTSYDRLRQATTGLRQDYDRRPEELPVGSICRYPDITGYDRLRQGYDRATTGLRPKVRPPW